MIQYNFVSLVNQNLPIKYRPNLHSEQQIHIAYTDKFNYLAAWIFPATKLKIGNYVLAVDIDSLFPHVSMFENLQLSRLFHRLLIIGNEIVIGSC